MSITGKLLYRGYQFDSALTLDLYGEIDEDGYAVRDVTLAGSSIGLGQIVDDGHLEDMGHWLDRHMQSDGLEHLVDRAEQDRLLRQGDQMWGCA